MDSTLLKGLNVLRHLVDAAVPVGVSALALQLGLPKSNIHRTLTTLVSAGFAVRHDNGTYEATLQVWEMGMRVIKRNQVRRAAVAFMHALQRETSETVNLVLPDGDDCLYVHQMSADAPMRISSTVGERVPAIMTISGRVMLAHRPGSEQMAAHLYKNHQPQPPFTLASLLSDLVQARKDGYAFSASHFRPGINSMAGVICDRQGLPVGAIAVAGPKERFSHDKMTALVQALLSACTGIRQALGG